MIQLKISETNIAICKFNAPDVRNAMCANSTDLINKLLDNLESEWAEGKSPSSELPKVFLFIPVSSGSPKVAMSGGHLKELAKFKSPSEVQTYCSSVRSLLDRIEKLPYVTIFASDGAVIGGGVEFASAFDLRVCTSNSKFQLKQLQIGLMTGWGGCRRLLNTFTVSQLKNFLWTGKSLDAEEARNIGFVTEVIPIDKDFEREVQAFAKKLSHLEPASVNAQKRVLHFASSKTYQAAELETYFFQSIWRNPKHDQFLQEFGEK